MRRTSLGRRLQRALTGGHNRRLPGLHPSPSGAASLSPFLHRRLALPIVAILALLVASLLPGSSLQAQDDGTIEYAENGTGPVATYTAVDPEGFAAIKWSLGGTDAAAFSINGGVLTFKKSPDFEMPGDVVGTSPSTAAANDNIYEVTVQATDGTGKTSMEEVTVTVTNVEEPGMVTLSALQPQAGTALTAFHSDPDTGVTDLKWQWARSRSKSGSYADIDKATSTAYVPADADIGYYLRATATYKDAESKETSKTAMVISDNAVQAKPSANNDPEFAEDQDPIMDEVQPNAARTVAENTAAGQAIGDPVVAEDDDDDVLTYTLTDEDGSTDGDSASFAIDRATGQLMTKGKLDYETKTTYTVVVRATDPSGVPQAGTAEPENSDTVMVVITVTDVNEPPAVTAVTGDAAVMFQEVDGDITDPLATYMEDNPEDDVVSTWSVAGADAGKFDINAAGALTFKAKPDYESPGDADKDNVYEVTVVATDADSNRGTKDVKVTVANEEEDGTVTLSQVQPRVGVAVTASLTDPDDSVSGVKWQWYNGAIDESDLTENAIAKARSATYTPKDADAEGNGGDGVTLYARASYTDGQGAAKSAVGTAANMVAEDTRNKAPVFEDQDDETDGTQNSEATREVAENTKAAVSNDNAIADVDSDNVGSPVTANDPDPNADPLAYTLSGADAALFRVRQDDSTTADVDEGGQIEVGAGTKLDYETKTTYTVTVMAADSFGATASIPVTIMVTPVDEPPDVTGNDELDYEEKGTIPVATYTAVDPEGFAAIKWSLGGTDAAAFSINGGVLTFKKSPDFEMPGDVVGTSPSTAAANDNIYEVTVQATDGTRNMGMEEVTVTVTNVEEPGMVTLSALQPQAGTALTAFHSDPDTGVTDLKWQWARSRSKSGSYADIDKATSTAYVPADADIGYYLRATATYKDAESKETSKTAMVISDNAVQAKPSANNDPEFAEDQDPIMDEVQPNAARTVAENTAAGQAIGDPVVAEDDDDDVLTYTLTDEDGSTDGDSASFAIDRATGQLMTKGKLDYETKTTYTVVVRATDPSGVPQAGTAEPENSDTVMVVITVTDVNEPPAVTAVTGDAAVMFQEVDGDITDPLATYMEDNPEDDVVSTWSVAGADAGKFDINAAGALTFKAKPDYESPGDADKDNVYEVTVVATDADSNRGTKDVKVTVANEEEDGTVTLSQVQPRVGVAVTASLTDPDDSVSGVKWQWYNGAIDESDLTENAIAKARSATYTPKDADAEGNGGDGVTLYARASYTDGQGAAKSAVGTAANMVAEDTRNKAPVFEDQDDETDGTQNSEATREVAENTKAAVSNDNAIADVDSDNVGSPVTANDPDPNADPLAYTLSGADAALFRVRQDDSTTADVDEGGQIEVGAGTKLDYETKTTYTVTVMAADSFGATASIPVTIMVTPVDEPPVISVGGLAVTGQSSVDYAEKDMGAVATYTASGPDAASARWSLSGDDAGDFTIPGGVLAFRSVPDYENPADMGGDNVYEVTVTANDGTNTATRAVTVTVTDVDEVGTVTLSATQPAVGTELTANLTDLDGGVTGVTWQWAGDAAADGTFADIDGATSAGYTPVDGDATRFLRATVSYTDAEGSGKSAMAVSANAVSTTPITVVDGYDADGSGTIDRAEVGQAVRDFIGKQIEHDDVVQVIAQYFKDLRSGS